MFVMVLNDEETFTGLEGCAIYEMSEDFEGFDIADAVADGEAILVHRFGATPFEGRSL